MLLTTRYQMWMAWGPADFLLPNDACRPTLGVKFPDAIGKSAREVWSEIWPDIGPLIELVFQTSVATYSEGMCCLILEHSGYPEEMYHTFSYSPLFDEQSMRSQIGTRTKGEVSNDDPQEWCNSLYAALKVFAREVGCTSIVYEGPPTWAKYFPSCNASIN